MKTLIMLRGIPASGKSTWSIDYVKAHTPHAVRINKDTLREMLHAGLWTREMEEDIVRARDSLIGTFLSMGKVVIVDDTNLHPKHEARLRQLADRHGALFNIVDFDVDLDVAVKRDAERPKPVGADVIRQMWDQKHQPRVD